MKTVLLILLLICLSAKAENLHIEYGVTNYISLPIVPMEFDSLLSLDIQKSYDRNGTVDGLILFIFENPLLKYDVDRKDKFADISDLIALVQYMFPREK